jgi:hypothetical protein
VTAMPNSFKTRIYMNIPDSVRLGPDPFDFDPEIMKPLFDEARELGRNPSSWVAAPALARMRLPWLINLLSELRRER